MGVIRAFIAISISPEILHRLQGVTQQLKDRLEDVPVRWVPVENMHLTLKFLGDVSEANVERIKEILEKVGRNCSPFEISVGELGAFPSLRRPRVIWAGVKAPPELKALQRSIDTETARLGYAREEREFSPHLTLGRASRNATPADSHRIGEVLASVKVGFLGVTRVDAVNLYRSDLRPQGSVYTCLASTVFQRNEKEQL
ncbi:MAG: RNA 2',3'-cyclic phosphodiesterase [Chloroflexi bacterium]|jgi:2'-5' RNA ligase|nr:RNA 2',3'-cyclic phosphodiesterase [Chloroflexota bacterium]